MWQGMQTITDYKGKHSCKLPSDTSLTDELNHFYDHFEASNTEACMTASAVPDECVITLSVAMRVRPLNRSRLAKATQGYTRLRGQTDYQDVCSGHVLNN
jgi:hypothetical protein